MYRMVAVTSHTELEKWISKRESVCEKKDFAQNPRLWQRYLEQIEKIAASKMQAVILREKDLPEAVYERLAKEVLAICEAYKKECILHTYANVALKLGVRKIHLPLAILEKMAGNSPEILAEFHVLGSSTHSVQEAERACRLGATYITAGHIYATDCKKGLSPRGISFLKDICEAVEVPVYAIGGINEENIDEVLRAGAAAGCIMSGAMRAFS